jgi:hypothetical protein
LPHGLPKWRNWQTRAILHFDHQKPRGTDDFPINANAAFHFYDLTVMTEPTTAPITTPNNPSASGEFRMWGTLMPVLGIAEDFEVSFPL